MKKVEAKNDSDRKCKIDITSVIDNMCQSLAAQIREVSRDLRQQ